MKAEVIAAFGFGVVFVIAMLVLATLFKEPTEFQYTVFRIVLAIAVAGAASVIPGIVEVELPIGIRAGGAFAVFVIVYFCSPAELANVRVRTAQEIEIDKPLLEGGDKLKSLVISSSNAGDSNDPNIWAGRYQSIRIDGIKVIVPEKAVLVANEIDAINGGSLTGTSYSVIARRIANLTIEATSKSSGDSSTPGPLYIYAKLFENSRVSAKGQDGANGSNGANGSIGNDGSNGENGNCGPGILGQFRASTPGNDGENGHPGQPGQNGNKGSDGGKFVLTTIVEPKTLIVDVSGGHGGIAGKGGKGGDGGRGGAGGSGCTGLGGNQPDRPGGKLGLRGSDGVDGVAGANGRDGEYRLITKQTFDGIVAMLKSTSNDKLHDSLQQLQ